MFSASFCCPLPLNFIFKACRVGDDEIHRRVPGGGNYWPVGTEGPHLKYLVRDQTNPSTQSKRSINSIKQIHQLNETYSSTQSNISINSLKHICANHFIILYQYSQSTDTDSSPTKRHCDCSVSLKPKAWFIQSTLCAYRPWALSSHSEVLQP